MRKIFDSHFLIIFLIVLGIVLYANTLPNQMFWDDFDNILNNRYIQNWSFFPKFFTENLIAGAGLSSNYWRPLLLTVFSLEWHFWGSWAPAYHFVNGALHITNAVLLLLILHRIFERHLREAQSKWLPFLTALIFLIHPVQTEAVAYVSNLGDLLSTFFIFLGVFFYLKFRDSRKRPSQSSPFFLTLLMYIFALMTKETAIVMPAFVFIIDFLFIDNERGLKERLRAALRRLCPFATIALVYLLLRATVLNFGGTFNLYEEENLLTGSFYIRMLTFFRVLTTYFGILLWPANLHMERSVAIATSLLSPDVLIGGCILLALIILAFAQFKKRPVLSFGILWFLVSLAPTSNLIVPINALIFEHWLYLPIVGIAFVFIWIGMFLAKRYSLQKIFLGTLFILLLPLQIITIARNREWHDPIAFYNQTLKYAPGSYRVINNLGMAYADVGDHKQAEETYRRALVLDPSNPVAYHNLGNTYRKTGRRDLAIESFQAAIELDPEFAFSYSALANLYLEEEDYQKAREVLENYLDHSTAKVDTLYLLAQIATEEGDLEGALAYLEEALEIDPQNWQIQSAVDQLEEALKSQNQ